MKQRLLKKKGRSIEARAYDRLRRRVFDGHSAGCQCQGCCDDRDLLIGKLDQVEFLW